MHTFFSLYGMSSEAPSSAQSGRSSQPRRNAGPSSAPAAPRVQKTYISTFRTKFGPNTHPGATTNPHRVYGFINSNGTRILISTNVLRNKFRNVAENNNGIVNIVKKRLKPFPKQYVQNIITNIIPIREKASRNATKQYKRRVAANKGTRKRQNIALNRNFDRNYPRGRMSWANYEIAKNTYKRNRKIENNRTRRDYNESFAAHQHEIDLWRKIQRLLPLYSNRVNYTRRPTALANKPIINNVQRDLARIVRSKLRRA